MDCKPPKLGAFFMGNSLVKTTKIWKQRKICFEYLLYFNHKLM